MALDILRAGRRFKPEHPQTLQVPSQLQGRRRVIIPQCIHHKLDIRSHRISDSLNVPQISFNSEAQKHLERPETLRYMPACRLHHFLNRVSPHSRNINRHSIPESPAQKLHHRRTQLLPLDIPQGRIYRRKAVYHKPGVVSPQVHRVIHLVFQYPPFGRVSSDQNRP